MLQVQSILMLLLDILCSWAESTSCMEPLHTSNDALHAVTQNVFRNGEIQLSTPCIHYCLPYMVQAPTFFYICVDCLLLVCNNYVRSKVQRFQLWTALFHAQWKSWRAWWQTVGLVKGSAYIKDDTLKVLSQLGALHRLPTGLRQIEQEQCNKLPGRTIKDL